MPRDETVAELGARLRDEGVNEFEIGTAIGARMAAEKACSEPFKNFPPIGGAR